MTPWHDDDQFWQTAAPAIFPQRMWARVPADVDAFLALLNLPPGAAILDMCCGPGRYALELARRGFNVVGVDRTESYLAEARRRAAAENLAVEFVHQDIREFRRPAAFDAALNLFTSFGYFADAADERQALVNLRQSLKPGGRLLMELMSKEILARIFQAHVWSEEDGVILLQECKVAESWNRIENRWIILQGSNRQELRFSHRVYSAFELTTLLQECGFDIIALYGDLAGAPYDQTAKRLVIVAQTTSA
jgi:SAM-dependent methyltransferase